MLKEKQPLMALILTIVEADIERKKSFKRELKKIY